jgi:tetratricopeptide (TPR) repeat protein
VVHTLLGLCFARLDDVGRAVEELKTAIEKAPIDGKNHLYLAQVYLARQRTKAGEEHLERAVELNPVLDEAWARLGELALDRLDYPTARQRFLNAAYLDPAKPALREQLALVYQRERNWSAADRELKALLARQPDNVGYILRLGLLHSERAMSASDHSERQAARAEATAWLERVLKAQPENALASRALEDLKSR